MKKAIAGSIFGLMIIAMMPQQAQASSWTEFIDWVRGATPQQIEKLKKDGPTAVPALSNVQFQASPTPTTSPAKVVVTLTAQHTGITNNGYQVRLSYKAGEQATSVRQWELYITCPGDVTVNSAIAISCNQSLKTNSSAGGNILDREFFFKNSSNVVKSVTAHLRAYDATGHIIGNAELTLRIPPTTSSSQTSTNTSSEANHSTTNTTNITTTNSTNSVTASFPTPRVTYPMGGERLQIGNTYSVKWYGGGAGDKMKVSLFETKTGAYTTIANNIVLTNGNPALYDGTVLWSIPTYVSPGTYKIRLERQATGEVINEGGIFTILASNMGVTLLNNLEPNQKFTVGQDLTIQYGAHDFSADARFEVRLAKRALVAQSPIETVQVIATLPATNGSYIWKIPTTLISNNNYLLVVCPVGAENAAANCMHTPVFTITPAATPSAAAPVSTNELRGHNIVANVFYALADMMDGTR